MNYNIKLTRPLFVFLIFSIYCSILHAQVFDPKTGEILPEDKVNIEIPIKYSFDPVTGKRIQIEQELDVSKVGTYNLLQKGTLFTDAEVIKMSEIQARLGHNTLTNISIGVIGFFGFYIGIPITTIYVESSIVTNSGKMANSFGKGLSNQQKMIYIKKYKEEQKNLRRNSVYITQGGLLFLLVSLL